MDNPFTILSFYQSTYHCGLSAPDVALDQHIYRSSRLLGVKNNPQKLLQVISRSDGFLTSLLFRVQRTCHQCLHVAVPRSLSGPVFERGFAMLNHPSGYVVVSSDSAMATNIPCSRSYACSSPIHPGASRSPINFGIAVPRASRCPKRVCKVQDSSPSSKSFASRYFFRGLIMGDSRQDRCRKWLLGVVFYVISVGVKCQPPWISIWHTRFKYHWQIARSGCEVRLLVEVENVKKKALTSGRQPCEISVFWSWQICILLLANAAAAFQQGEGRGYKGRSDSETTANQWMKISRMSDRASNEGVPYMPDPGNSYISTKDMQPRYIYGTHRGEIQLKARKRLYIRGIDFIPSLACV